MRPIDADALVNELRELQFTPELPSVILTPAGQEIYNSGIDMAMGMALSSNILSLNTLRDAIYQDAVAHGLWDDMDYPTDCAWKVKDEAEELCDAASEWEDDGWDEDEENDDFSEELADVIIMALSVAGKLGLDIDKAVKRKMEINKGRAYRHEGEKNGSHID